MAAPNKLPNLVIENARIMFRNFAGLEKPFNSAGDRNFVVFLDDDLAERLERDGWNVKRLRPREEDEGSPQAYMQVSLSYGKGQPPRVVVLTSKARTDLGADEVAFLDFADIKLVDLVINPYAWEVNGNTGIKAYLKSAFITLNEDELELKYAEDPTGQTPGTVQNSTATEEVSV